MPHDRRKLREELFACVVDTLCRHLVEILKDNSFHLDRNIANIRRWIRKVLVLWRIAEFIYDSSFHLFVCMSSFCHTNAFHEAGHVFQLRERLPSLARA